MNPFEISHHSPLSEILAPTEPTRCETFLVEPTVVHGTTDLLIQIIFEESIFRRKTLKKYKNIFWRKKKKKKRRSKK